ncbi:MAG: rod shape-determining protein MreD [Gammaproteobacteria bacterium]|jgi:rod shape-determining protein MreD|nr:rod shape-determining protein MreD [Gammaproteobacteria bacterium]
MSTLIRHHGGAVIFFTFVAALVLTVVPLPDDLRILRPDWVLLVLIYWCMALPQRVGVGIGWLLGLFTDVLTGTLLGQHALAYGLVAFLTLKLHQRLRLYPLWQQALSMLVLLALGQLLMLWINGIVGRPIHSWLYWMPSLTGALLWPFVFLLLRGLRRAFRVT